MSTLAVLQNNDIILPPLKSISRMSTLSPKTDRTRGANVFNVNGAIKIPKSQRFESYERSGYESYNYIRESDFDGKNKKGTYIEPRSGSILDSFSLGQIQMIVNIVFLHVYPES